jgi:hypothetical protein
MTTFELSTIVRFISAPNTLRMGGPRTQITVPSTTVVRPRMRVWCPPGHDVRPDGPLGASAGLDLSQLRWVVVAARDGQLRAPDRRAGKR